VEKVNHEKEVIRLDKAPGRRRITIDGIER